MEASSTTGFTAGELIRAAASESLGLTPAELSAQEMETPLFRGRLLAHEVQPGLTITANDITYLHDQDIGVEVDPSLICGIQISGDEETMTIGDHGAVSKRREQPVLVGFCKPSRCIRRCLPDQRDCSVGFMLKPSFFDKFDAVAADEGVTALKEFLEVDFRTETLARSPRLLELARRCLDHPYNGQLAHLFLESHALSLVIEVADQLRRERRLVASVGRKHYERVMAAVEMLDADIVNPPASMDLARTLGVNITDLRATFKAVMGMTIFDYVRNQRLRMAQVLLREHGVSVAEAGYRVGFSRPAAFSAAYRRHFGHPPGKDAGR